MTPEQFKAATDAIDSGKSVTQAARLAGVPRTTLRERLDTITFPPRAVPDQPQPVGPTKTGSIDFPVPVLRREVPVPKVQQRVRTDSNVLTSLLYGDSHFPFQDDAALAIVFQIAADLQPDILGHVGDLLDCYALSRFDKNPHRKTTIQQEIDMARVHLAQMQAACPSAHRLLFEGNHEDRLRRVLWSMRGEVSALNQITAFREAMTWPSLLGLESLGFDFFPYSGAVEVLPKFLLKHGKIVRSYSGMSARSEMEGYNRSGASGHTHRLGEYFRTDYNGGHVWIETGCTCSIRPEYVSDPNWQNGCVILSFDKLTGAVGSELVHIINGKAVWRGKVYTA